MSYRARGSRTNPFVTSLVTSDAAATAREGDDSGGPRASSLLTSVPPPLSQRAARALARAGEEEEDKGRGTWNVHYARVLRETGGDVEAATRAAKDAVRRMVNARATCNAQLAAGANGLTMRVCERADVALQAGDADAACGPCVSVKRAHARRDTSTLRGRVAAAAAAADEARVAANITRAVRDTPAADNWNRFIGINRDAVAAWIAALDAAERTDDAPDGGAAAAAAAARATLNALTEAVGAGNLADATGDARRRGGEGDAVAVEGDRPMLVFAYEPSLYIASLDAQAAARGRARLDMHMGAVVAGGGGGGGGGGAAAARPAASPDAMTLLYDASLALPLTPADWRSMTPPRRVSTLGSLLELACSVNANAPSVTAYRLRDVQWRALAAEVCGALSTAAGVIPGFQHGDPHVFNVMLVPDGGVGELPRTFEYADADGSVLRVGVALHQAAPAADAAVSITATGLNTVLAASGVAAAASAAAAGLSEDGVRGGGDATSLLTLAQHVEFFTHALALPVRAVLIDYDAVTSYDQRVSTRFGEKVRDDLGAGGWPLFDFFRFAASVYRAVFEACEGDMSRAPSWFAAWHAFVCRWVPLPLATLQPEYVMPEYVTYPSERGMRVWRAAYASTRIPSMADVLTDEYFDYFRATM